MLFSVRHQLRMHRRTNPADTGLRWERREGRIERGIVGTNLRECLLENGFGGEALGG
jgi:hypothetical protein